MGQLGADFITAQQRTGVAATAKHFPGLGSAAKGQNTDKRPVTLNVSLTAIRNTDEVPYQAAIAAGVRLVMVSWAVYPALAPGRPAGLSSRDRGRRAAPAPRLHRRDDHRRARGRRAEEVRPDQQPGPARGPGRNGPAALLGTELRRR